MFKIIVLLFLYGCSQVPVTKPSPLEEDNVTVDTALMHIKASYLRGCVDAFKDMKLPISFETCRDKAQLHREEVQSIMDQLP
ncbi:MAG: hypothetical protein H0V66_09900 [Bdellovibrionales bacterium]|nr:hypothetical protein [Bdellovibrionales bacterium]